MAKLTHISFWKGAETGEVILYRATKNSTPVLKNYEYPNEFLFASNNSKCLEEFGENIFIIHLKNSFKIEGTSEYIFLPEDIIEYEIIKLN